MESTTPSANEGRGMVGRVLAKQPKRGCNPTNLTATNSLLGPVCKVPQLILFCGSCNKSHAPKERWEAKDVDVVSFELGTVAVFIRTWVQWCPQNASSTPRFTKPRRTQGPLLQASDDIAGASSLARANSAVNWKLQHRNTEIERERERERARETEKQRKRNIE